jgi:maltose operon periplasmic protein
MKKMLPICIAIALLSGCATNVQNIDTTAKTSQTSEIVNTSFNTIEWKHLDIPSNVKFKLDNNSQSFSSSQSAGPIASFTVPGDRGAITINLESFASSTLYAPNIMILDSKNTVLQTFGFEEFEYVPARLLDADLVKGKFTFIPPLTAKEIKVLVFTTPEDLQTSTELLHPAKAYAIARNTVPPEIPNPVAQHSPYGTFRLDIASGVSSVPVVNSTPIVADQAPSKAETKYFYLNSIEKSVNNGDINKAMKLLDEAERLGIEDARSTFIRALEAKK